MIQLPTFNEINGVSEAINGVETKIREEVESKLSNINNGSESRIDEKLVLKADLVNGRVPASQSPAFKDVEGAKGALDGLKEALTTKYDQKVVELSEGKADLVDGKIPTSQLPIDGIATPLEFQLKSQELDTKFSNLEDSVEAEKNAFITQAGNLIAGKANAVDVYDKVNIDNKLDGKVDKAVYAGEIVKKADQTYVDAVIGAISTDATPTIPVATETIAGKAKIATTAIAQAGVDDTDFLTAKKLRDVLGVDTQARLNLQTLSFAFQKNVSTVTLVSTGVYEVNLTNPLLSVNYSIVGETMTASWGANSLVKLDPAFAKTTTKFRLKVISSYDGTVFNFIGDIFFKVIENV